MKTIFVTAAIFAAAISLAFQGSVAGASTPAENGTGTYVSSVPPVYPTQEQQTGTMWGATEIVGCPDSYKLLFDNPPSSTDLPPAPSCVPMTADELSGGAQ